MFPDARAHVILLLLGRLTLVAHSLSITPPTIDQQEGDSQVHFSCLENNKVFATDITWEDPQGNLYTLGSPSEGGNARITVADSGRLFIHNLIRTDSGNYRCFRNSDATDDAQASLLVYAPPEILNAMPVQEIHHGATSLLNCKIDRGYPEGNIHWLRVSETGDAVLEEITATSHERFTIVENGLEISNVQSSDEGRYRCYVQNDHGVDASDIHAAFRASPKFVDDSVELNIVLPVGQSVSLDCAAAGAPLPNYTWSVPPHSQSAQELPRTDSMLVIQLSNDSDAGEYKCTVDNGEGIITRIFTINVATSPQPALKNQNLTITLNQPTTLNCTINAIPKPNFRWEHDTTTREQFPESSWVSTYDNVMGTSTLTHVFEAAQLNKDCTIRVVCIADNDYGQSEHHFVLLPDDANSCLRDSVTTEPTTPKPPIIQTHEPNIEGIEGVTANNEKSDTTKWIIIGVIAVAATCIVVGVFVLLLYFIKHFRNKRKQTIQLSSVNHTADPPSTNCQSGSSTADMRSTVLAGHHTTSSTAIHMEDGHTSGVGLGQSVDSGVSLSSMGSIQTQNHIAHSVSHLPNDPRVPQPTPYLMPSTSVPRHLARRPLPEEPGGGAKEGFYHRLNHNLPSCSSSSIASRPPMRLSSSSSANSSSPLLQSQSSSELEDSLNGSVFITNPAELQQSHLLLSRQRSQSAADPHHVIECHGTGQHDTDDMFPNPAYGSNRKFKLSVDESEKAHVYETIA
jgi:hypothetical protein